MKNKSYAVIGLGQFGMTVALTLAEANCDVLAIDDKDALESRIWLGDEFPRTWL